MQRDTASFTVFDAGITVDPMIPYFGASPGKIFVMDVTVDAIENTLFQFKAAWNSFFFAYLVYLGEKQIKLKIKLNSTLK